MWFSLLWALAWQFRVGFEAKVFLHKMHMYGLSPMWTLIWYFRVVFSASVLWQQLHKYGLSWVWVLMWESRTPFFANTFRQLLHLYCFSPEWVQCGKSADSSEKMLSDRNCPYNGFTPAWGLLWKSRRLFLANALWHKLHLCGFTPVWNYYMICL